MEETKRTYSQAVLIALVVGLLFGTLIGSEWQAWRTRQAATQAVETLTNALGGVGVAPSATAGTAGLTTTAAGGGIDFAGSGTANGDSFHLDSGNYRLAWNAQCGALPIFMLTLNDADSLPVQVFADPSGDSVLHNVAAGDYYVSTVGSCSWTGHLSAA